jgi:hypothetical protein
MRRRLKVVAVGVTVVVAALIAAYFYSMRPVTEQEVLAADRIDFVSEMPIPDGGSYVFSFRLPHNRSLVIQVLHRRADLGGNAEFQEIRIDRLTKPYIDVRPRSALEAKLLALLQTARIDTNATPSYATLPSPERLQWLCERIRDRKAKW